MTDSRTSVSHWWPSKRYSQSVQKTGACQEGKGTCAQARAAPESAPQGATWRDLGVSLRAFRWVFRLIWVITWRSTAVVAADAGCWRGYVYTTLAVPERAAGRPRARICNLAGPRRRCVCLAGGSVRRAWYAKTVSKHLKNAVIATEDKRFYRHFGLARAGSPVAVRINLSEGRGPLSGHGGSTITQQTAKLLCSGREL